ncbi:MAG: hypothetical protein KJ697_01625 [Nanoarchaeota archaeon]|nr:hypothetical protein [Nanoarchaeota archaeon]
MVEHKIIKCPFCKEGDIETLFTPRRSQTMVTRAAGRSKSYSVMKDEKYTVSSDNCPKCGKSKQELQKALMHGIVPSKEDVIRRAKESGLPLRF